MKTSYILALALALVSANTVFAQDSETKIKITPTGRILMDGALYGGPDHEMFKDGVTIPDIRMGLKASYGNWSAKIDVGYAGGKVGLKDVFLQYTFDKEWLIKGGSFIHQYGLQSSTSSSMKCTFEEPLSNTVFNASRQIGVAGIYNGQKFLGSWSAHVEPQSMILSPNQLNHQGFGFLTRMIARPIHSDGKVVQVGISAGYTTAQTRGETAAHNGMSFTGTFPTRVDKVTIVNANLTDARYMVKFTPELLLNYDRLALESQYFYNHVVQRAGLKGFTGQGAYATLRGMILGKGYTYSMSDGGLATPAPKTLECVMMYNYTKLSDKKSQWIDDNGVVMDGVYGGRVNTFSATLNYYINKYMLVRLNYAYTHRWDAADMPRVSLNTVQARVQILF